MGLKNNILKVLLWIVVIPASSFAWLCTSQTNNFKVCRKNRVCLLSSSVEQNGQTDLQSIVKPNDPFDDNSKKEEDSNLISLENYEEEEDGLHLDNDTDEKEIQDDEIILSPGKSDGFFVVQTYQTPSKFNLQNSALDDVDENRLGLQDINVTLPVALMLLDPIEYPSQSRARKACRKGQILIHRNQNTLDNDAESTNICDSDTSIEFNSNECIVGRVGDRVYPGDVIGKQVRMGSGSYPVMNYKKPPFDLPIVYEDDHFAIVNKPAGVVVYSHRNAGHGIMTIRSALPFVITPPSKGTYAVLRRPQTVHRLDKPTSGLLLVAKTKPAMTDMTRQFVERKVKKTYHAIVNGIPDEPQQTSISSVDAKNMGVDVDCSIQGDMENNDKNDKEKQWQVIDFTLEEKEAVSVWKAMKYSKSLKAKDGYLTLVQVKPKTGRYHQIRRHMAWVCECPLVGDLEYDGGGDAMSLRERGLMLCSNKVALEHPYYNTEIGRKEWDALDDDSPEKYGNGMLYLSKENNGDKVMVSASIPLPDKFYNFLAHEEKRAELFQ